MCLGAAKSPKIAGEVENLAYLFAQRVTSRLVKIALAP